MLDNTQMQVLERSGLCLSCTGEWILTAGRVKCIAKEIILNKCPKTTCKYFNRTAPGSRPPNLGGYDHTRDQEICQQNQSIEVIFEKMHPGYFEFIQIGDIDRWRMKEGVMGKP
jgi:hypothetical protein